MYKLLLTTSAFVHRNRRGVRGADMGRERTGTNNKVILAHNRQCYCPDVQQRLRPGCRWGERVVLVSKTEIGIC